ncbi:unnamed protein product [Rotaria socialis]|uniref:TIR domain-containing protein n=1 Tax=Rotaria socialis TaxID=392032 RepID=A0A820IHX9_9BILA|nr:unnamed protein product [Rotaria socialis]CAF4309032.1 unnamed protein product [Rotaria socialis]
MDATIITQQCNVLLNQSDISKRNEHLNEFFSSVTEELTKCSLPMTDFNLITTIVSTLIGIDKNQFGKQSHLMKHKLLIILRDYLIKFFFNQEQNHLINNLSILFYNICYGSVLTDENIQLFVYKPLIDEICLFYEKIEKYVDETKLIQANGRLLKIYQRIHMFRFGLQENSILEILFITITKCIVSNFFIKKLENLPKMMSQLNPIEILLFDSCIEFMYWQPYESNAVERKHLFTICETLLQTVVGLMSSSIVSEPLIRLACFISLNIIVGSNDNAADENTIDANYYHLMDYCISMLDHRGTIITKRALLSTLCHCAYNIDMIVYLKNNLLLKPLLLKMCESDDTEISFNSYRILAIIMNEEDIKTLANSSKIVSLFYIYFISMIDDSIQIMTFQSLLHSLKSLVQHEQIKIELVKIETVPLLIRCVIEANFQKTKIPQYALEILLTLSFNDEALKVLEKEVNFMSHLKVLENSTEETIQRGANHLLWLFDQKIQSPIMSKSGSFSSRYKFDIMLSYSHTDKKICFQIYENLVRDGFHVWIDRDQMHGDTMAAMANAIENSEFVVICMSEAYKQSPYCQAEAHYAFQRQCKLIPLVMKAKYKPEGWLGIIVSGKIYVDFSKFQFDSAYSILKNEIQRKRIATTILDSNKIYLDPHLRVPLLSSSSVGQDRPIVDLPLCIDAWSEDHVRSFLRNNNLTSLLPVFPDFNGSLLYQAYSMCQAGRESMFQAMRNEVVTHETVPPLTLATYLRFLERLKSYIPINVNDQSQRPIPTLCNIM